MPATKPLGTQTPTAPGARRTVAAITASAATAAVAVAILSPSAADAKPRTCPKKPGTVARGSGSVLWQSGGRLYGCHEAGPTVSLAAWHPTDLASVYESSAAWTTRKGKGTEAIDRVSAYEFEDERPHGWLVRQASLPKDAKHARDVEKVVAVRADSRAVVWVTGSGVVALALRDADDDVRPTLEPAAGGTGDTGDSDDRTGSGDAAGSRSTPAGGDASPPAGTKLRPDGKAVRVTTVDPADAARIGRFLRLRFVDGEGDECDGTQTVSLAVPASRSTPAVVLRWSRTLHSYGLPYC